MNLKFKFSSFFLILALNINVFAQQVENGFEFYEKGEYEKSAEVLQKAVEADEKDKKSWLYLGMSYVKLGNNKQAVKAFNKADKIEYKQPTGNETPAKIISKQRVRYTEAARQNMVTGTIKIVVELGTDGNVKNAIAFKTLPYGLTENCMVSAKNIKFQPATRNGEFVPYVAIVSYSFEIY